jgi:hypothetical protein
MDPIVFVQTSLLVRDIVSEFEALRRIDTEEKRNALIQKLEFFIQRLTPSKPPVATMNPSSANYII